MVSKQELEALSAKMDDVQTMVATIAGLVAGGGAGASLGYQIGRNFDSLPAGMLDNEIRRRLIDMAASPSRQVLASPASKPSKRRISAYNRRYRAAFKKCQGKHKKKSGGWKKGGYKRCVKEAHKMAKRGKK